MQDRTDKLRGQVWRHLEVGQWHSAALLAEHMREIDPLSGLTGLAEATRVLAMISEGIRLNEPIDPYVIVRLDEIARTWPRLGGMRSFKALAQAVEEASAKGLESQTSLSSVVASSAPPGTLHSGWKTRRGLLRRIAKVRGCAGVFASIPCALVVLLISQLQPGD